MPGYPLGALNQVLNSLPNTTIALDIGLGCGFSSTAIAKTVSHLDVVEINPVMQDTLRFFNNEKLLTNPTVSIHIANILDYLPVNQIAYDFINVDLSAPPLDYVSSFYTTKYFSLLKTNLKPNGIIRIWLCCGSYEYVKDFYWTLKQTFDNVLVKADTSGGDDDIENLEFYVGSVAQTDSEITLQSRLDAEKIYEISTESDPSIARTWDEWVKRVFPAYEGS